MRILHVLGKLDRGGVETWLVQTLRHIDRSKYQFDFLVHSAEPGAYDDDVKALGARVIPCLAPSNPVRFGWNFFKILREYGPYDCVHSHVHHFSGYVMFLAAIGGVPVRIAHSHTARVETNASGLRRFYLSAMKMLIRKCSTRAIAVSSEAGVMLFGAPAEQYGWEVQPLGIDIARFQEPTQRGCARESLSIPIDALVVGHVGRFAEPKNHRFFIEVAHELIKKDSNCVFLLVGDGPLRAEIERSISIRGIADRFRFAGLRDDVPRLLSAMDVFLFPSLYEGFPLALIEAQAAGLHCLVSDVISKEADLDPSLVYRLPLRETAERWAQKIADLDATGLQKRGPGDITETHGIGSATKRLCLAYETNVERAG